MPDAPKPDLTEFFKYSKPKRPPCRIGYALTQLKPAERKQLEAALATDKNLITASAIIEWLKIRGIESPSVSAITGHRKETCTCHD